jgi:hypothetical protein
MRWCPIAFVLLAGQSVEMDVSRLTVGAPTVVAKIDLGKLRGEPRKLCWSPDLSHMYLQTLEGTVPSERLHHYLIASDGGDTTTLREEPEWAQSYWRYKSDRSAPGLPSVMIDVQEKLESIKFGTGSAGAADRSSSGLGADNINAPQNLERAADHQKQDVVRLMLSDEPISVFVNERPIPGLLFSWGPSGTGLIAYVSEAGQFVLMDHGKRRKPLPGFKSVLLPAWTVDGTRLAFLQKNGRKTYSIMSAPVDVPSRP